MAIGTDTLTCYQDEDVLWTFTVTDTNVSSISGWTITLVVKATAVATNPALLGPITATITGTLTCRIATQITVDPGSYVYSLRRTDLGTAWQLAQGTLTVVDSAHIDI